MIYLFEFLRFIWFNFVLYFWKVIQKKYYIIKINIIYEFFSSFKIYGKKMLYIFEKRSYKR